MGLYTTEPEPATVLRGTSLNPPLVFSSRRSLLRTQVLDLQLAGRREIPPAAGLLRNAERRADEAAPSAIPAASAGGEGVTEPATFVKQFGHEALRGLMTLRQSWANHLPTLPTMRRPVASFEWLVKRNQNVSKLHSTIAHDAGSAQIKRASMSLFYKAMHGIRRLQTKGRFVHACVSGYYKRYFSLIWIAMRRTLAYRLRRETSRDTLHSKEGLGLVYAA